MFTNILKKIAVFFNRAACALENRADHIDKLKTLEILKVENDALRGEVFDLEEEMNAKNSEIDDLNEKADHPTRHKLEACINEVLVALTNRVDDLEKALDRLRGKHDDCAELNDAIDEDDDKYIDPIERIMAMKPVGQFPPEDADTPEKKRKSYA